MDQRNPSPRPPSAGRRADIRGSTLVEDRTVGTSPRLVIVDLPGLLPEALASVLARVYATARIAGAGPSAARLALGTVMGRSPDVAVVSLDLGRAAEVELLIGKLASGGVPVVAMTSTTSTADPRGWGRCLAAGAAAVISTSDELDTLLDVLERVRLGESVMPKVMVAELLAIARAEAEGSAVLSTAEAGRRVSGLTTDEHELLQALSTGMTLRDVADMRFIAETRVRTQLRTICAKLQVSSTLSALAVADVANRPPAGKQ
jgi:DNA-binding NarL/FixJ family response regulator